MYHLTGPCGKDVKDPLTREALKLKEYWLHESQWDVRVTKWEEIYKWRMNIVIVIL